jgi:FkbM family methyltransferase
MKMISYAQNHEDVVLNRLFPHDYVGFYVDIGANDPVSNSITKHFYDGGWSGVNVEPGRAFPKLQNHRPRDINLNVAVSRVPGRAFFFDFPDAPSDGTLEYVVARENERKSVSCERKQVKLITLSQLCDEHTKGRTIDFMSIDVEGHEGEVIAGGDWKRFRPRILIVEATRPHSRKPSHQSWEPVLLRHDYRFALFDGLNRFFVRAEDSAFLPLLSTAACIFDDYVRYDVLSEVEWLLLHSADFRRHSAGFLGWLFLEGPHASGESLALRAGVRLARLISRAGRRLPWLTHMNRWRSHVDKAA